MATTSPDNLRTPNPGDPYNLVADLATLANDVQSALNLRANTYKGTASARTAFLGTATAGTLWQDTDSFKMLWKKDVAAWVPAVWRWVGTTTEMNAFAAPNGFQWYDTTTGRTMFRLGGAWTPRSSVWNATASASVANGWTVHNASAKWVAQGPVKAWSDGYVAPVAGLYRVEFAVQLAGQNNLVAAIKKNNLVNDFTGTVIRASTGGISGETGITIVSTIQLAANDRVTPATYWAGTSTSMDTGPSRFSVEVVL